MINFVTQLSTRSSLDPSTISQLSRALISHLQSPDSVNSTATRRSLIATGPDGRFAAPYIRAIIRLNTADTTKSYSSGTRMRITVPISSIENPQRATHLPFSAAQYHGDHGSNHSGDVYDGLRIYDAIRHNLRAPLSDVLHHRIGYLNDPTHRSVP
jgi:hypothetical protein